MRLGGLGLRSAERMSQAAFWASWADALHMLDQRLPRVTEQIVTALTEGVPGEGCLAELAAAASSLDRDGFVSRPSWVELRSGVRPMSYTAEPGEWPHGWQYYASSSSEHHFRRSIVLASSSAADRAHLRSHSGIGAASVFNGAPTAIEYEVRPEHFRALVLERLRLPLPITEAKCECGAPLDQRGCHRAACPRSGRLRSRAVPVERTLARVCHEAGATVRCNVKLRDLNVAVAAHDERAIEVIASGLPCYHGAQLAVDVTLRSPLTSCGSARSRAADEDGAILARARKDKETKYSELTTGARCRLVVVALETGGRWSDEAATFVRLLAEARARDAPPCLRKSMSLAWARRWTRMLAVAAGSAFATSLVSPTAALGADQADGAAPQPSCLLAEPAGAATIRLPLR